jgi:TetR/AcrR family tetracycline transcriptional repressor
MANRRGPGQRAGLTNAAVLGAARAILVERGLAELTMRAVADALGVAPNALYSHVASKRALVDALHDDVLAEVTEPATAEPKAGVREVMISSYEVLLRHADLLPIYLARQGSRGPNAQRLGVIMDALLSLAGLSPDSVGEARRALIVYTIGYATFSGSQVPLGPNDGAPMPPDVVRRDFERGLDWLLTGITGS